MKLNVHLIWPDGLAVWFFLRIFHIKFGRGPGFNSQSGPFSFFSSLRVINERNQDLGVVYNCCLGAGHCFGKYHTLRRPPTSTCWHGGSWTFIGGLILKVYFNHTYYHTLSFRCAISFNAPLFCFTAFTGRATHATDMIFKSTPTCSPSTPHRSINETIEWNNTE